MFAYAKDASELANGIGNMALRGSQRPGPLVSFGENIIDQYEIQIYLAPDDYIGVNKYSSDIVTSFIYGITDSLSILLNVPLALRYQQEQNHSSGLEDFALQMEYAFYATTTADYTDQATIVSNLTLPTGSSTQQPSTGFGSPSFFLGGTFNRTYTHWFGFTSSGVVWTTTHDQTTFGNQFLYQFGLGRNILAIDSQLIVACLIEMNGIYSGKNTINGFTDPNSGGNIIYATPSLWISSPHWIFQIGIGSAVAQHLLGNQANNNYLFAASIGLSL